MQNRSSLINFLFVFFIVSLAVVISVRSKWAALVAVADQQNDTHIVKHTGYYDRRAITGADGDTEIPVDRIDRNPYSSSMIGEFRGVSTTSTMQVP